MRILFLGNNWLGWQVASWLLEQNEKIVGVVVHPPHKRKYGDEIISSANVAPTHVFDGAQLRQPETIEAIRALNPDIALSVMFGYILRPEIIGIFPSGVVNLHPSFLPYNKGAYPNVWSIIEGTPAGASLHYIDSGVDTGDIIAQRQVTVEPADTGGSLYEKLQDAALELFKETWQSIRSGRAVRRAQTLESGTYHRTSDVERIDEILLERAYTGRELIDIIRARTFPPYNGAYFLDEAGRKIYLRLQLYYEDVRSSA